MRRPDCGAGAGSLPSLIDALRMGLAAAPTPVVGGDWDFGANGSGARHDTSLTPAAVLVPIVQRAEPGLLLTTRTSHLRTHAGQVAFPGGRIDATDAGPVAAALREAHEEIGLDPIHVEVLGQCDAYQTGTGYSISPIVGVIPADLSFLLSPHEVADVFELPLAFALDPANHHLREALWRGRMRRFYAIEHEGRMIWGATAALLVNLSGMLKARN